VRLLTASGIVLSQDAIINIYQRLIDAHLNAFTVFTAYTWLMLNRWCTR